uniref:hypothetical protein n=1 Tax=Alistipes sp. TaxID=1872444 RepID=UPI0040572A14
MRRLLLVLLLLYGVAGVASAQGVRVVQGAVRDPRDMPMVGVDICTPSGEVVCTTGEDGQFMAKIRSSIQYLVVRIETYKTRTVEVDGSFLLFRMEIDEAYYAALEARRQAELEEQRRRQAELEAHRRDSLRQIEIHRRDSLRSVVEARRAAREAFLRDSIAAVRQRENFLRDSIAAARARQQQLEEKLVRQREDSLSALAAAKKRERRDGVRAKSDADNKRFRNKGFITSLEFAFIPQSKKGQIIYTNLGYQSYNGLNPIEVNFMAGYRFSNWVALNLGVGFLYNTVDLISNGDTFSEEVYGEVDFKKYDIPLFVNGRFYLRRGKVQPIITLSAGIYTATSTFLMEAGAGLNLRLERRGNLYFVISAKSAPWINFQAEAYNGYKAPISPNFSLGITL